MRFRWGPADDPALIGRQLGAQLRRRARRCAPCAPTIERDLPLLEAFGERPGIGFVIRPSRTTVNASSLVWINMASACHRVLTGARQMFLICSNGRSGDPWRSVDLWCPRLCTLRMGQAGRAEDDPGMRRPLRARRHVVGLDERCELPDRAAWRSPEMPAVWFAAGGSAFLAAGEYERGAGCEQS